VGKRFLFVRNPDGETTAMSRLSTSQAIVETLDVYRQSLVQQLPPKVAECLRLGKLDAITATSKNIARQTVALLGNESRTQTWLSLSPSITSLLVDLGCERVITASEPSFDALVALKLA
jgi:uroporphyrinogen-III synthase